MGPTSTDATAADGAAPTARHPLLTDPTVVLVPPLAIVTVLVMSTPGWLPLATVLVVVAWLALGVVWVVAVVARLRARRAHRSDHRPFAPMVVYPGFLAIVLVLAASALPLRARFSLSRDELAATADAVLGAGVSVPDTRIGSFPTESVETDGHAVWFITAGLGTDDRWGFVYRPDAEPDEPGVTLLALDGGWYAFHQGDARFPFL